MRELVLILLRQGLRPFEITNRLSLPYDVVHKIALGSGIDYPGKHITDEDKQQIRTLRELEGLPIRTIAMQMGIGKSTVGRWSRARFLKVQDEGGKAVAPEALKVPRRCPQHGLVRLWPCVACAARGPSRL